MTAAKQTSSTVDFGFREVKREEKAPLVHEVFSSVADHYDVMNDLMSVGMHRLWKQRFVQGTPLYNGMRILDLAGGTGDIAFLLHDKAQTQHADIAITVADINGDMLRKGKARALDRGILKGLSWQEADAEALPFADNSFDVCTIAFGIRNVTNRDQALAEIFRVLKPGGLFSCMEFNRVKNPVLQKIYDTYSFEIIPAIGEWIAKDRASYQYLVESIRQFPAPEVFAEMIRKAGFERVCLERLSLGAVTIYSGWKL